MKRERKKFVPSRVCSPIMNGGSQKVNKGNEFIFYFFSTWFCWFQICYAEDAKRLLNKGRRKLNYHLKSLTLDFKHNFKAIYLSQRHLPLFLKGTPADPNIFA